MQREVVSLGKDFHAIAQVFHCNRQSQLIKPGPFVRNIRLLAYAFGNFQPTLGESRCIVNPEKSSIEIAGHEFTGACRQNSRWRQIHIEQRKNASPILILYRYQRHISGLECCIHVAEPAEVRCLETQHVAVQKQGVPTGSP
ncbi:hypothetical protein D3C81_1639820 [compost metagenome]